MSRFQHFRKHQPANSWAGVVFVVLLGAFDLALIGYLVHGLWVLR